MTIEQFRTKYAYTTEDVTYPIMSGDVYSGFPSDTVGWHKDAGIVVGYPVAHDVPYTAIADQQIGQAEYWFVDGKLARIYLHLRNPVSSGKVFEAMAARHGAWIGGSHQRTWRVGDGSITATSGGTIDFVDTNLFEELNAREQRTDRG